MIKQRKFLISSKDCGEKLQFLSKIAEIENLMNGMLKKHEICQTIEQSKSQIMSNDWAK